MEPLIQKLAVGGIKLSPELIQIHLLPGSAAAVNQVFRRLADFRVNLTLVSLEAMAGPLTGVFTIFAEDRLSAESALQPFRGAFELLSPVGALTIFPHHSQPALIGGLLAVLGAAGLPVYGLASSLSALTVTTDYRLLDQAVAAVCRLVDLPDNHAPFRPEFRVKQL